MKAVVLVSGGLDSCVTAAIAGQDHQLAFLHMNYGQRTQARELRAFHEIAEFYGVQEKLIVDAGFFAQIGGSSLTDSSMEVTQADLSQSGIPSSYVPFRNANILSIAVSWAEVIGAQKIFIGAVEEDSSGYPDCRQDFFKAYEQAIKLGTKPGTNIKIETPVMHLNKAQIVKKGLELKTPMYLTWSCYQNEKLACGICDSCALRLRGFAQAGETDPVPYVKI